jgi:hypothetical protein
MRLCTTTPFLYTAIAALAGFADAQMPSPSNSAVPGLSTPLKLHQVQPILRKPLLTGLGCTLDAANADSYRLINTNTYAIPAHTKVTVFASKGGKTADINSTWTTSDPINPSDYLRVGNYSPDLGLTTCWAITSYLGP